MATGDSACLVTLGIAENTGEISTWFAASAADDASRLRELERENARLKRIVADKELEIDALKEIARGNW